MFQNVLTTHIIYYQSISEFIGENGLNQSSNTISLKTIHGAGSVSTILLAKSSQRYRLQSDSMASLCIVLREIVERLRKHYSNEANFKITSGTSLPVQQLLEHVRRHYEKRRSVTQLRVPN